MRVGSICSGIAADVVAVERAGLPWEHAWFAEIAAFPSRVLAHHYPGVPNLGDFTSIGHDAPAIDLLMASTPCQSFSVAGLRGGLTDARGNLALEFARLAGRVKPRWVVWENVPGALSADEGEAFRSILSALDVLGYRLAWRVLDAQGFGLAQRRKRVFLVGYLGGGIDPAEVLFEPEGVLGDSPARGETRTGPALGFEGGAGSHVVGTLGATGSGRGYRVGADEAAAGHVVAHTLRGAGFTAGEDGTGRGTPLVVAKTLLGHAPRIDGETETFAITYGIRSDAMREGIARTPSPDASGVMRLRNPGMGISKELSPTLDTGTAHACAVIPFDETQITSAGNRSRCAPGSPAPTLAKGARPPAIAFNDYPASGQGTRIVQPGVRRLTPTECERLMGVPDGYTAIHGAKDGPRYAALGNSIAVPCLEWIFRRINAAEDG